VTRAGPKLRAGLMLQKSMGISTAWATKTAKPIAGGWEEGVITLRRTKWLWRVGRVYR
jgi:hypothetical protein